MSNLNEIITSLRKESHLTQKELAKILSIAERNYQKLESGENLPSAETLLSLMSYYDIPVNFLLEKGIFAKKDLLEELMPIILRSLSNFSFSDEYLNSKFLNKLEEVKKAPLFKQMIFASFFLNDIIVSESGVNFVWKIS